MSLFFSCSYIYNCCDHIWPFCSPDKTAAVDESADAGTEMTEEEWNLRVAELNKHQVGVCNQEINLTY